MITIAFLAISWWSTIFYPLPPVSHYLPIATGEATYYAPGLMQRVWQYRLSRGDIGVCPECYDGKGVAVLDCAWLGRRVWLQPLGGITETATSPIVGPFLVADCAQVEHRKMLEERGWVVDVPYELAMAWHMRGPIEVSVLIKSESNVINKYSITGRLQAALRSVESQPTGVTDMGRAGRREKHLYHYAAANWQR